MTKLEHIVDYKGYAIMIWRVVEGWMKGTRYFTVGTREYRSLKDVKRQIDAWRAY